MFPHLIEQESGGHAGAIGPQTVYGRAQGIGQVLPSTGKAVAAQLGLDWRPDLMAGTTPGAADYQTAISRGYWEQALNATGNVTDALHYYHGGPDRSLWGPKTQAYAANVLRRMGVQ